MKPFVKLAALLSALVMGEYCPKVAGAEPAAIPTKTVNSIAELRDVNPTTNQVVLVLDYYSTYVNSLESTHRGRGGGVFRWRTDVATSAEDGGFIITNNAVTSGVWERVLNGETPNVKMWGARGNDYTDDTDALQRALNGVRNFGNDLHFPSAIYLITNTLEFANCMHIFGEGPQSASLVRMKWGIDKDIFRTKDATFALNAHGSLTIAGNGQFQDSSNNIVDFAHGLIFEKMALAFGNGSSNWFAANQTGAGLCIPQAGDAMTIRNIIVWGGGIGVRSLAPGTPGLKVSDSSFFYQSTAGVSVEGIRYTSGGNTNYFASLGGPVTITSINGDLVSTNQEPTASLVLFSNVWPTATISDVSVEGWYGNGVIRCLLPPTNPGVNSGNVYGSLKVTGGTANMAGGGISTNGYDWVVLATNNTSVTRTPIVLLEPGNLYGIRYLIRDDYAGRKINVLPPGFDQVPLRRQVQYESSQYIGTEINSRLVYGDTIYQWFSPTNAGWWRIVRPTYSHTTGGHIAINSYFDSSGFEFNVDGTTTPDINVTRKSKAGGYTPLATKVRGLSFWNTNIGGVSTAYGPRSAVEIYIDRVPNTGVPWYDQVLITMPLDMRENGSGLVDLVSPYFTGDTSATSTAPSLSGESSYTSTGVISLLR